MPDDRVAIKYYQPRRKMVHVGEDTYLFRVRANISMDFVKKEHVRIILNMKGGCCGQKKKGVFRYANDDDIRRWTNGGGR